MSSGLHRRLIPPNRELSLNRPLSQLRKRVQDDPAYLRELVERATLRAVATLTDQGKG